MISLLAAAKATLRVIGLATVMHGNPGIDVVMPPVPNSAAPEVEEHMPVLIVRDSELVKPTDGWTTGTYREGFTFVDLTGEDVQFLPDASNPVAKVPFELPRLTNGCQGIVAPARPVAAGGTPVAHAGPANNENGSRPLLSLGYRAPLYEAAAAVLRVPYGSTNACSLQNEKRSRVDTMVEWDSGRGVTIVGKRHKTRLRLKGDEILIVAGNMPKSLLLPEEHQEPHLDTGHFKGYYAMLHVMGRQGCVQQPAEDIQDCPESTIRRVPLGRDGLPQATRRPVPELMRIVTSECSNSQYP